MLRPIGAALLPVRTHVARHAPSLIVPSLSVRLCTDLALNPPERLEMGVDPTSSQFQDNASHMTSIVEMLKKDIDLAKQGGGEKDVARHIKRGKKVPRERIKLLLDPGTEFFELTPLAGNLRGRMFKEDIPSGGLITGIGTIGGRYVMIIANDPTVMAGVYLPPTAKKKMRAQEIAMQNRIPCLYLVESGGGYLPLQAEGFADRDHFGRIFYNQAQMSAARIPQLAVVTGSCTAGGAYVPAMCDEVLIVRKHGTIFLGGPPLVKAATGEVVTAEDLGGADVHTTESGVADIAVDTEEEAFHLCRRMVQNLNTPKLSSVLPSEPFDEPLFPSENLRGMAPKEPGVSGQPFPVRPVIGHIVDGSVFDEFKPRYGAEIVAGFATIGGQTVGIVGNNGPLTGRACLKGAHFVLLCSQRKIPIVFLTNTQGYDPKDETAIKESSKMISAVATSESPKISVIIGDNVGPSSFAMCPRSLSPRFMFLWPNARIAYGLPDPDDMGVAAEEAENAGGLEAQKAAAEYTAMKMDRGPRPKQPPPEAELPEGTKPLPSFLYSALIDAQSNAYYSTARIWDDGVIDPAETRDYLKSALDVIAHAPEKESNLGYMRM